MAKKKKTVEGVSARKPGETQGEGRLQKVEKQQKRERKVPVGQLQRGVKPGDVDVRTGRTKPSTWQRVKAFATRKERPDAPTATFEQRMTNIGRLGDIGRGGVSRGRRKPGGILDIEAYRGQTRGPSKPTAPGGEKMRPGGLTLEEKKRKGLRVTAADVPGTGEAPTRGEGIPEIERVGEGGLGKFKGRGYKPPPPKKKPPRKAKAKPKPRPKKKWWERALEVTKELSAEAQRDAAKYEERKAGKKKDVKKAQRKLEKLPPTPKRKRRGGPTRIKKEEYKGSPPPPKDQAAKSKAITERLMKRRRKEQAEQVERMR